MGLLDLFIASSIPVLKVLLMTGLESYLALDRINILGDDSRKHLNNVVFFVFNPALVSSNLAKTITYEAWLSCNLGNLLLIIIPAVCKERGSPFGNPDVSHTYGMAYASLSMAIGAIYLWSYVYNIVRVSSSRSSMEVEIGDSTISYSSRETSSPSGKTWTEPLLPSDDFTGAEDHANGLALPRDRFENNKPQVFFGDKIKHHFKKLSKKMNLRRLLAPSTTGSIVGFVIGLVPQIRKLMISDTAPLRVIQDTALMIGAGMELFQR